LYITNKKDGSVQEISNARDPNEDTVIRDIGSSVVALSEAAVSENKHSEALIDDTVTIETGSTKTEDTDRINVQSLFAVYLPWAIEALKVKDELAKSAGIESTKIADTRLIN
jgi:hypothetical protein